MQTTFAEYRETHTLTGLGQVPTTRTCTAGDPANGLPNPVLTRTTIIDTTPPTVSLTAPVNGGLFAVGDVVPMRYTSADATAVTTCAGTVANNAAISTTTPGVKALSVLAVDGAGNIAQRLVSVRVVPASFTTRYTTSELSLVDTAAAFFSTDRNGFARFGVTVLQYLVAVNGPPSTPVSPPPTNNGPVALVTQYTPAQAQMVGITATQYGLTGDQLHRFGATVLEYIYLVSPH